MTPPYNTRLFALTLFSLAACFSTIELSADERQPLLRYLGIGWGAGYHSYNPHSAIHAAHGYCCTDRYSRPANFGCVDCGQSAGGVNYQGYGYGASYPPRNHGNLNHMAPQSVPQNQATPQSRQSPPAAETLPSPGSGSLPSLQTPPIDSGSKQNPFGVTSHFPQRYVPAPSRQQLQNQVPAQLRYRSAQPVQSRQNQLVTNANYNQRQSQINYQASRPQFYSSNPMQYRLNTNQQRLQQAFRPDVQPSKVYRGIR